jgi:hypothetical protein
LTKQLLFFKIDKNGIFNGDYLIKVNVDNYKLKGDIFYMHSSKKWIKIDLNTKEIIK